MKWSALIFLMIIFFLIGYCGHPAFPYAHIQLEKSTKLIPSHFQEEYHTFIHNTLNNKKTQLVCLYYFYKPRKNASRTDITKYDQKDDAFAPKYGDGSTYFHLHMIAVVVFYYSNTLQSMLVDYAVTEMGCFDYYLDASPRAKTMRVNGITTFLLHIAQCITFHQNKLYSNTYFQNKFEVVIFKVRFQGSSIFFNISSFRKGSREISF